MKEQETDDRWIDRYNEGELSDTERSLFRAKMETDPLLRHEVGLDARLNAFLADEGLLDLMDKIRQRPVRQAARRRLRRLLAAAAVLPVVVAAAITWAWLRPAVPTPMPAGERGGPAGLSDPGFHTLRPYSSAFAGQTVRLATAGEEGSRTTARFRLTLQDGQTVRDFRVYGAREVFVPTAGLSPGIYYWRLTTEKGSQRCGKIGLLPG